MAGAEAYFQRYGIVSLLIGRFIGPLRPMLPMVAGMCDMPFPRFLAVSLLAGAGWSVAYLLGRAAATGAALPLPEGFWPQAAIVAIGPAALLGLSINSGLRRHPRTTQLIAGLSSSAAGCPVYRLPLLKQFDQGVMALVQEHRSPSMDYAAVVITSLGEFRTQFCVALLLTCLLFLCRQWRHAVLSAPRWRVRQWPIP